MTPVIPTLNVDGWDTTPLSQMSKLWEYYQASDYSLIPLEVESSL